MGTLFCLSMTESGPIIDRDLGLAWMLKHVLTYPYKSSKFFDRVCLWMDDVPTMTEADKVPILNHIVNWMDIYH